MFRAFGINLTVSSDKNIQYPYQKVPLIEKQRRVIKITAMQRDLELRSQPQQPKWSPGGTII